MRIGIDVSWAQGPPSGTATYITGLVEALARVGPHRRQQSPVESVVADDIFAAERWRRGVRSRVEWHGLRAERA